MTIDLTLQRTQANLQEAREALKRVEMHIAYSHQIDELQAIANSCKEAKEKERLQHQLRQYRMLATEVGYEEAHKLVFEQGYQLKGGEKLGLRK